MAVIINWWLGGPVQPGIGFQNKHEIIKLDKNVIYLAL